MTEPRMTRENVVEALQRTGYNVKAAAVLLDVHRVSLHRFMRENVIEIARYIKPAA